MGEKDKSSGRQPEALTTFEKAARSGGRKPPDQGVTATPETAPRPDDPKRKADAATDVLRAGVDNDPARATDTVRKSRDPRVPR